MPTQDRREETDGAPGRRPGARKTSGKSVVGPAGRSTGRAVANPARHAAPEDMSADLESQAVDYMADNDLWMYGPNAATVLEMLERLEEIDPEQGRALAEAWQAEPKAGRETARKSIRKLFENDLEIARYLGMAREQVASWVSVKADYPPYQEAEPDWPQLCTQAGEATLDALTSVILERELSRADRAALFEPWLRAIAQLPAGAGTGSGTGTGAGSNADDEDEEEGKYGPNSAAVVDFLNRLWLLAPEQVARLVSGWDRAPREALSLAHESLHAVVDEDPDWRDQVRLAQDQLVPWLNGGRIQDSSGFLGDSGQAGFRKMAGPAIADAIAALVLGDLLPAGDAIALYSPWFNLVGAPELLLANEEDESRSEPSPEA